MLRFAIIGCLALLVGCNAGEGAGKKLATHKVSGKVTKEGNPVVGATVTFSPKTKGNPPAMGITDTQGVYILTTYDPGDGAVEGSYKVILFKEAPKAEASGPTHDPTGKSSPKSAPPAAHAGAAGKGGGTSGSLLGDKYATADSPIEKEVKTGKQEINIEL